MALEHALLVSLRELPAAGLDLARRFDRSIGFFWAATHQQIYRTLARMERDGWVTVETVAQAGRPAKKVYAVSVRGDEVLDEWLGNPPPPATDRNDLAVKMRGASFATDPVRVHEVVRTELAEHQARLHHYERLEADYPDPGALRGRELDQYLVLRGGLRLEQFWVAWLTEYLQAHQQSTDQANDQTDETGRADPPDRPTPKEER